VAVAVVHQQLVATLMAQQTLVAMVVQVRQTQSQVLPLHTRAVAVVEHKALRLEMLAQVARAVAVRVQDKRQSEQMQPLELQTQAAAAVVVVNGQLQVIQMQRAAQA
jgi:hypothetical protein